MDKVFLTVLNMSLTGSFVILVICLARLPLKKAPKIISYCLWAVVGFRLVFPFSIESVFSLIPDKVTEIATAIPNAEHEYHVDLFPIAPQGAMVDIERSPNGFGGATIYDALSWLWIIGVAVMLIYGIVSYSLLKNKMRSAIRVEEGIYESDTVQSPFVLGVLKPKIYIPIGLSGVERKYIILHEQTHIRRCDHIIKFMAYFILCLHWFNPFAWVAFLLMSVDMEMSCDERVLNEMGEETRKAYSLSLLSFVTNRRVIGGSPLAFCEGGLKQRIKNVLNFKKPSRVIITLAMALVAVLSVGFAVNKAAKIELPAVDDVLSVTLNRYNEYQPIGDVTVTDKNEISQLLDVLSDAKKTWQKSVNDNPVSSNYLVVRLHLENEMRILYLYTDGVDYIEEPYIAIYRPKKKFNFLFSMYGAYLNEQGVIASDESLVSIGDKAMTLDDIRNLASKGDSLIFEDFQQYRGGDASSNSNYHLMVYSVEGGYRLIVSADASGGKPGRADLESIWESSGSGIDIRHNDVDEFVRTHPSHPAVIGDEALAIAEAYAGKYVTLIDTDWWEREDEFPHDIKDPFKQMLNESMNSLGETCELFTDADGGFIAVGRKSGTVYIYNYGAWSHFTGTSSVSSGLAGESTQVNYNEIQQNVNSRNESWRLNPEEVAAEYATRILNLKGTTALYRNDGSEYARVIFTKQSGAEIHIDLYQPAKKGEGGIWAVECWFDENSRMYQVRDLTALPPLFSNDDNVPVRVQEAVRTVIVDEWTETFGRYYQVLGFYASNVNYMETGNSAELKFIMNLVTQNFYKDPDTVGYIKEAKEKGSSGYQQMYDEYNMPRNGNVDMKVTMSLTSSGEVEPDSIQIYSNISPHGEEYVPTKAKDFIISE